MTFAQHLQVADPVYLALTADGVLRAVDAFQELLHRLLVQAAAFQHGSLQIIAQFAHKLL